MTSNARFAERIGKIFIPIAETIIGGGKELESPEAGLTQPVHQGLGGDYDNPMPIPWYEQQRLFPWKRRYVTSLKAGCYSISFTPANTALLGTRFRGTMRVEWTSGDLRFSGDLYSHAPMEDLVGNRLLRSVSQSGTIGGDIGSGEAADTGGTIPVYPRRQYHSYLKGTRAYLVKYINSESERSFTLDFDEFVYKHQDVGFGGSFNPDMPRSIRLIFRDTGTANLYSGKAYDKSGLIGTVSIRWISDFFRRATLQINTLEGGEAPPASVDGSTFATIFADAGWDLSVTDRGTTGLPPALADIDINNLADENLEEFMESVPGYNASDLDAVWRAHLISWPSDPGFGGVMFDSSSGPFPGNFNGVPREGSFTFSRAKHANEAYYDEAANQEFRNVPRAFLRSATHEVGHVFGQIHQHVEGEADNSIMSRTVDVATFIGPGKYPDEINLSFNRRVMTHLRHRPDPAVRPGAMDFLGGAIDAPEASAVTWPEQLTMSVDTSSRQISLGEPMELRLELNNNGNQPLPVPKTLDVESLIARINVTDPSGRITFMRPAKVAACPKFSCIDLLPGRSIKSTTILFWGTEGFAFETPGRHIVEVIVLWSIAGVPVAVSGRQNVFVSYPTSKADNEVAELLLDPVVGRAIASRRPWAFKGAVDRIHRVLKIARKHPAATAIVRIMGPSGPTKQRTQPSRRLSPGKRRQA